MELRTAIQPIITPRTNAAPVVINLRPANRESTRVTPVSEGKDGEDSGKRKSFIEANTKEVGLSHLEQDCIIPVFAKDNESTINHQQFIGVMQQCCQVLFGGSNGPEIRVSHIIKGRTPGAIGKPAKDLLEHEKTLYYERMAFTLEIPNHSALVCGNRLNLTVGGVRAYNHENLYGKKSIERFKVFIGHQNTLCTNLCVSSDGFVEELKAASIDQLAEGIMQMMQAYNRQQHLS